MKVWRLGNGENFVGKREELVFDAFIDSEPVEKAYRMGVIWQDLEALTTVIMRQYKRERSGYTGDEIIKMVCHPRASTCYDQPIYQIRSL